MPSHPPSIRQAAARPDIPYGAASGDVTRDRAIVWSRTDRPARMLVEWSTTESFQNVPRVRGPQTTEAAGYTARVDLTGLPPGQRIFYRVQFEDLADSRNLSIPAGGTFSQRRRAARDVTFAWSADTVGQGWGINTAWGGLRMYETMRLARPDFFIHTGDTIYADSPVPPEIKLPDGTMWRNVVTPEKSKVAETLDEFRGNYTYNLLDDNVRRFNREIPQLWLWDDHEVRNNWYPGMSLDTDERYTAEGLARARGERATGVSRVFADSSVARRSSADLPIVLVWSAPRGVRDRSADVPRSEHSNRQASAGADTVHAGARQLAWLKRALSCVHGPTWKVIASDLPIGLVVRDGTDRIRSDRERRSRALRSAASWRSPICCASSGRSGFATSSG